VGDSYSIFWGEPEERVASAAVAPASVEEVQKVVRIANKYKVALYPISTGRNLTYGGSSPTMSGSVVVDLKRMNKVITVDDKRHFALVEPGVSYFDLYRYIKDNKLKVWMDIPDPGWGSPMGNSLDHGVGYTTGPFRDHFGSHCGMEVVTPEGDIMRTGMGALPGSDSWQEHKYGVGPQVDGLFAQSNFGIVTKMGFWLMPEPEAYLTGTITAPKYQDLHALVEQVSYLENSSLIGLPAFGSPLLGGFPGAPPPPDPDRDAMMGAGWPSNEAIDAFVAKKGKPAWSVTLQFYGPEDTVKSNWAFAKKRFAEAIPGSAFQDGPPLLQMPVPPQVEAMLPVKTQFGIPALSVFTITTRHEFNDADPPDGHADFIALVPRTGQAVMDANKVMHDTYKQMGYPPVTTPFSTPIGWWQRAFLIATIVPTYRVPERNKKARALFGKLIDNFAAKGWGEYRTAPAFQEQLVSKFSFGNHALLRFQEKLKDAIDPNGIISPGRYGIWPKRFRKPRA
jgi:hypothetical protein